MEAEEGESAECPESPRVKFLDKDGVMNSALETDVVAG